MSTDNAGDTSVIRQVVMRRDAKGGTHDDTRHSSPGPRIAGRPAVGRIDRARMVLMLLAGLSVLVFAVFRAEAASALTTAENCALPGSGFQGGDGNQDTPTFAEQTFCTGNLLPTTLDWQHLTGVVNSPDPQEPDNVFAGGNKESEPGKWKIEFQKGGATPEKSNIISAWSKVDPQPTGTFLYMAFLRGATTGDTFLAFTLNQVKGLWENEQKAKIPCRSSGDVLIAYNHSGSGVEVVLYHFVTDTFKEVELVEGDPGKHQCATSGHFDPASGTPVTVPDSQGALNATEIQNYLEDTANKPTPTKFPAGSFGEASINLTAAFKEAELSPCFAFGQMWMASRSSLSIDSQLQDYVLPVSIQANSCSISGRKFDDANGDGKDEPSKPGLEGWTIQLYDSTGTKLVAETKTGKEGSYTFTNVFPGTYVIKEVGQNGWTCDYPGTGTKCMYTVILNSSNVNSTGNDFGNKPTTTVTTEQTPMSGVVGTQFGDSAKVKGSITAPEPTGNVEFRLYSDNECGNVVGGPIIVALSRGAAEVPAASRVTPGPGSYWWVASYVGDNGNAAGRSECAAEPITVDQAAPAIKTAAVTPVTVGAKIKDTATLSGLVNPTGSGTVTFKLYSDKECKTEVFSSTSAAIKANGAVDSGEYETKAAGEYFWVASFSGDTNNKAAATSCGDAGETSVVDRAKPGISTTVKDKEGNPVTIELPAALGNEVHDTATLTGQVASISLDGTATVTYHFFAASHECKAKPADQQVTVAADGSVPDSAARKLGAGEYSYYATYSGNANYEGVTSSCESFRISQAKPLIETTVKDGKSATVDNGKPALLGTAVHDTVSISGTADFSLGGTATVTYRFFANNTCWGEVLPSEETVTVGADNAVPDSSATAALGAGEYSYQATYSGNADFESATSGCEPFKVSEAKPAISTTVKDSEGKPVGDAEPVPAGSSVHDAATLSGQVGSFSLDSTATVTYHIFAASHECKGTPADQQVTVAADGSVPDSSATAALGAGEYSYQATYSGNANYEGVSSGCEPFKISQATPVVATAQEPASATVGATFKDKTTISGLFGSPPGGTISWALYGNDKCAGAPVATDGPVAVTGNGSYSTPLGAALGAAGTYYWVASYGGDANNKAVTSGCAAEPITVAAAPAAGILPEKVVVGAAGAYGPFGCVAGATPIYVRGRQVKSVTFYVDGHKVKVLTKPDKSGRYLIRVKPRSLGARRIRMVVVFTTASGTRPKTLHAVVILCRKPRPRFTG